jgi:D-arabinose 1-dehydrogenase-like Zn-dependent alcohol dehydrogenase
VYRFVQSCHSQQTPKTDPRPDRGTLVVDVSLESRPGSRSWKKENCGPAKPFWCRGPAVLAATSGQGADHILEIAGGPNLGKSVEAAAVGGQISVIGVIEGLDLSFSVIPLFYKQVRIRGLLVGHRRAAEDFVTAVDAVKLKPVIDGRYELQDLQSALAHLERGPFGKVVVNL